MVEIVLDDSKYSYVKSTKVITLAAPYNALSLGQVVKIVDLTTKSIFYDCENQKNPISISGADITHTYSDENDANADKFQITIDVGVFFLISNNGYSTVTKNWNAAVQTVFEIDDDTEYEVIGIAVNFTNAEAGSTWTLQMHRAWAPAGADYDTAGDAYTKEVGVGGVGIEISDIAHYGYVKLTAQSDDALDDGKALKITYIKKPLE